MSGARRSASRRDRLRHQAPAGGTDGGRRPGSRSVCSLVRRRRGVLRPRTTSTVRQLGLGYAVGVPATHPVTDGAGHRWQARQVLNKVRPGQWMRRQTGDGAKGRREYDWAWLDIRADDTPGRCATAGRDECPRRPPPPLHRRDLLLPLLGNRGTSPSAPSWRSSAAVGRSRRRSSSRRASPAWTRARSPAGTPGCAGRCSP